VPAAEAPVPLRAARVARLERAVRTGSYRPDAHAIAEALLRAIDAAAGAIEEAPPV
jgi:anti-sigma28 factor (negative regulator of flagellin synthesis)